MVLWEVGSRRKKKPSEGIYSFLFSHSPVSQNSPSTEGEVWREDRPKQKRDAEGKLEKLSTARSRELLLVSEMRAFLYKMMYLHHTVLTWLRN